MKQWLYAAVAVLALGGATAGFAAQSAPMAGSANGPTKIGVVNFRQCIEQSKIGQQEQKQFEDMRKQFDSVLEEKEKKLNDFASKFNDPNYVDSLSPDAENEAKKEYRTLSQEVGQLQNQYYQMLNQANMKILQKLADTIGQASETVAKAKGLDVVLSEDSVFFFNSNLNVTGDVVKAMDTVFASQPAEPAPKPKVEDKTKPAPAKK